MKTKYIIFVAIFATLSLTSCKDFLDKGPLTNPSSDGFFSGRTQVEEYVNTLYIRIPSFATYGMGPLGVDKNSDNIVAEKYDRRLNGEYTVNSGEDIWVSIYNRLREANYLIKYFAVPEGTSTPDTKSLLGEAYFFRAWWHFNLLKNFGSAPIMDDVWDNNATINGLQKDPATRGDLAKFILSDLATADTMLLDRSVYKGRRVNKQAAQLLAMNVALYEGSWEYYHKNDAFAAPVDDHEFFLNKVLEIGDVLMSSGITLNTKENNRLGTAFAELFNSHDLSDIDEVLFWRGYSIPKGIYHNIGGLLKAGVVDDAGPAGITKSLVDCYLNVDGRPIENLSSDTYKDFAGTFAARDPRLLQTVMNPGANWASSANGNSKPMYVAEYSDENKELLSPPRLNGDGQSKNLTGYHIRLGINETYTQGYSDTAYPILRYAEALLDYAEAAEILGRMTDEILEKTIKPLRDRAGVAYVKPDGTDLNYPDYGYVLSPTMREIRRERRVELALQGHRFDDLMRWKGEKLIVGKRGKGAYLGDNSVLFKSFDETNRKEIKSKVILDDQNYLDPNGIRLPNGYQFNPNRDYLLPIPSTELNLEKLLKQNPGW